jgi:hypothetical protein
MLSRLDQGGGLRPMEFIRLVEYAGGRAAMDKSVRVYHSHEEMKADEYRWQSRPVGADGRG